ncbi:MAG: anaerobic sulfatase-maturation protein [Bacteroidetes bacterium]|nr:anaerobic sulfatase-maturation protein [Bacteroidota bacterium]
MYSRKNPTDFHLIIKPHGPICNLDCTYCYYTEKKKLYPGVHDFIISDELLEDFIRQYIESQDAPTVTFGWQGGEPALLGIDFFKKVVNLQNKYRNGKNIENTFQSNGILLNTDWCKFFHNNNFLVGISIDGPMEIHNKYRIDRTGKTYFDDVMKTIEQLKNHQVEFNTLTVVGRHNAGFPLEVYSFLKTIGSRYMQFMPLVERINHSAKDKELCLVTPECKTNTSVTECSVNPENYGKFLITIFDEWVRNDVGRIFVQLFDTTLANWAGESPGLCVFDKTCGSAMVLEHNGDLYSCDHYVYPEYRLGNIKYTHLKDMARSDRQMKFGQNKLLTLPSYCTRCEYLFACHGGCPKHRFEISPDGEPGLNCLCSAYKTFFSYIHPYMQFMSDELAKKQPPANVMETARKYKTYREAEKTTDKM